MSKKILTFTAVIYGASLLQSTVVDYIEIFGVKPNLLLIVTISAALMRTDLNAAFIGLGCGLAMDVLIGKALGWYGIIFFLVCFFIGMINTKLYKDNPLIPIFFIFTSSMVMETLYYSIYYFLRGYEDFIFIFTNLILPESVYNALLAFPIYKFVFYICKKVDKFSYTHNRI